MAGGRQDSSHMELIRPEQSVIGSMLIDPQVVGLVVDALGEGDFVLETDRRLFAAFRALYLAGGAVDLITVLDRAGREDKALQSYAMQLMDLTPTAAHIEEYIAMTRRGAQLLRLRELGAQLSVLEEPEEALPLLRQGTELLSQQGRDDEADMERSLLDFYGDLQRTPSYLPWGLEPLDQGLTVEGGDFVVLAGRPSDGKTALALRMAVRQAADRRVGFFSLETGRKRLFSRLMVSQSGVPGGALKRRMISDMEYTLLAGAAEELRKAQLTIVEATGWTVEQIEARAMARRLEVVYIDYLQLIRPSDRRRSGRVDEVSDISRALANMARHHGITVVAISQLSRPEKGARREPILADLRESGQIEQDADLVMFVWRKSEQESQGERTLTVAKNKEGPLGRWSLTFDGSLQRFRVAEPKTMGEYAALGREVKARNRRQSGLMGQMGLRELHGSDPDNPFTAKEGRDGTDRQAAAAADQRGAAPPGAGPADGGTGSEPGP